MGDRPFRETAFHPSQYLSWISSTPISGSRSLRCCGTERSSVVATMAQADLEIRLRRAILWVLVVSVFLNLYGIWWGLPSYRGWATDELFPAKVFRGMLSGLSFGAVYPPFHYYLLTILYSPLALLHLLHIVDVRSLPTYTFLFYVGRCVSVIMGTGIVLLVYLCGREIKMGKSSVFAALIIALVCPFIYYSKIANLDVPY